MCWLSHPKALSSQFFLKLAIWIVWLPGIPEIYQVTWWMGHFGSLTMKRHIAWSNCRTVACFDLGVMAKEYQERNFRHGAKSARSYRNKQGKKAYHGTKYLKGTQTLSWMLMLHHPTCMVWYNSVCYDKLWGMPWGRLKLFDKNHPMYLHDDLRTYPPRFGMKLVRLHARFVQNKEALPENAFTVGASDAMEVFARMEWGDWWVQCANMKSVFAYLRGSSDLELGEWRPLFPTYF